MKDRMHSLKCWKALTIHAIEILKYRDYKNAEPRELGIRLFLKGSGLKNTLQSKILSCTPCHRVTVSPVVLREFCVDAVNPAEYSLLFLSSCVHVHLSEWQRTGINGESTSMVWPTLGSRTAKEQNTVIRIMCWCASNVLLAHSVDRIITTRQL